MASALQKQVANAITQPFQETSTTLKTTQQSITNKAQLTLVDTQDRTKNTINSGISTITGNTNTVNKTNSAQQITNLKNNTTKATDTNKKTLSNGGEIVEIDLGAYTAQDFTPIKANNSALTAFVKTNFQGQLGDSVSLLINKSIDQIVEDQIGLKTKDLIKSDAGLLYQEGKAVYEKILKSEQTISHMRDTYTKGITDGVTNSVNKTLDKLGNKGVGGAVRNFLVQTQLAQAVTDSINLMVTSTIKALVNDQMIKNVSKQMIDTVKSIKKQCIGTLKNTFKNQLEYAKKLKTAIQDKFKAFEEAKAKFLKKITDVINDINQKISAYLTKVTQMITEKLTSLVAGALGGLTKGLSF